MISPIVEAGSAQVTVRLPGSLAMTLSRVGAVGTTMSYIAIVAVSYITAQNIGLF